MDKDNYMRNTTLERLKEKFNLLKPLLAVFGFVFITTASISYLLNLSTVMDIGITLMGVFFLTFGSFKLYNLEGFKEAFKSYDLLAERSNFYATAYPFMEVGVGALYLSLLYYRPLNLQIIAHISALTLMSIGSLGVFHAIREDKDLKCACLGNVFNVPMTKVTLTENLLMAGMAAAMLITIL